MERKKLVHLVCCILACGLLLTACGGNTGTSGGAATVPAGSEKPQGESQAPKTSLVFGLPSEPTTLMTGMASEKMGAALVTNLYDLLINVDDSGKFVPMLAERWEISEDGLDYTLYLRKDVKFHNGYDFTADDVVFSIWDYHMNKPVSKSNFQNLAGVEKIDDYTVKLHYSSYSSIILVGLAQYNSGMISKKYFEEVGEEAYQQNPVGTGPYKYVSRKSGDSLVLAANEAYWNGAPAIKDITLKIVADANSAVIALQTGELDGYFRLPVTNKQEIMDSPNLTWYESETPSTMYVIFNLDNPTYKDKNVRQAIAYALNKEDIVYGAVDGLGTVMDNLFPNNIPAYPGPIADYEQNLDKAKELLAASGYGPNNKLNVKMVSSEQAMYLKPNEVFQAQLNATGVINATLDKMENASFTEAIMTAKTYDCTIFNITYYMDPSLKLDQHFYSNGSRNYHNLKDAQIDALGKAANKEPDPAKRIPLYKELVEIVRDEAYMIPLYQTYIAGVSNASLKGYKIPPIYESCFRFDLLHWE